MAIRHSRPGVGNLRRLFLAISLFFPLGASAQELTLVSWNIQHLGRTKTDEQIETMARLLGHADVVAIQEVVAKDPAGAQAVGRLGEALRRLGADWEYRISDPTKASPQQSERYAILWRKDRLTLLGRPELARHLADSVAREPFIARFRSELGDMILINFHAVPHNQQPEREIKLVRELAWAHGSIPVIFLADWNVVDHHTVFNPLRKKGYHFALRGQATTLKRRCDDAGSYRNHGIDNILLPSAFTVRQAGVYDFVGDCENLEAARQLSDHLPVWVRIAASVTRP
jgi:deoxyribonuclease-1-like protein